MRGVVEIWDGDKLILEEPNMLVDGAGELLADIMTVSPSLSGLEAPTISILDASNYRIQAISFGTGSYYFNNGARKLDSDKQNLINSIYAPLLSRGELSISPFIFLPQAENTLSPVYYNPDFTSTYDGLSLRIDKASILDLPISPNPTLKTLEVNTDTSTLIPLGDSEDAGTLALSSVFPGNGQHCNFLPSAIMSSVMENTEFSSVENSYYTAASVMGSFPEGSSAPFTNLVDPVRVFYKDSASTKVLLKCHGTFNEASSMDVSGFVTNIMSSVPDSTYSMSSIASGLCLSAPVEETNKGFPFAEYSLLIGSGDLGHVNAYGGIYHMGLWTIDMNKSLRNDNTPPFAFSVLNNPRKYRLFCRKGLSKNLCFTTNQEDYKDLTLKWRIYFR